jgi:hypothetical protein
MLLLANYITMYSSFNAIDIGIGSTHGIILHYPLAQVSLESSVLLFDYQLSFSFVILELVTLED